MYLRPIQFARLTPRQKMAASLSGFGLLQRSGVQTVDAASGATVDMTTTATSVPETTRPVTLTSGFIPTASRVASFQQPVMDPRPGPLLLPSAGGSKPIYSAEVVKTLTRIDSSSTSSDGAPSSDEAPQYAEGSTPTTVDPSWFREQEETGGTPYVPPTATTPVREVRPQTATPGGVAIAQVAPRSLVGRGVVAQVMDLPTPVKVAGIALGAYLLWRWAK